MTKRPPILRLRAGILVLGMLIILAAMVPRWAMALAPIGLGWAALIGAATAVLAAAALTRLDVRAYAAIAAAATLLVLYTVYDFSRGPIDWSRGTAAALALGAGALLAAALWDFWKLIGEFRAWAASDD